MSFVPFNHKTRRIPMTDFPLIRLTGRQFGVALLAATLAFSAGCAAKPKAIPAVAATGATRTSEAAPTTRPPQIAEAPRTQPQVLAPITPTQEFSDGANAGLRPQASVAPGGAGGGSQIASSLNEAGDRIYFLTDRFDLTDDARTVLARQAAWISANPNKRVIIAGSADERGTREYNLALGSRRASSVRDYLVSLGVNGSAIETVSYGKERPIDARSNPEGWAVNRNAQTQLLD
jgi:peptidoglycan-associated lipoprotein